MQGTGLAGGMSESELLERAEQTSEQLFEQLKKQVKTEVSDLGTLRKQLRITVPGELISGRIQKEYDDLRGDAHVPGFRKGRAPKQLIQKRFGTDIRESLKTTVVGQSFYASVDNEKLEVLGEPLFQVTLDDGGVKLLDINEALTHIRLPDTGDFSYACEVELKPAFDLPELRGIEVKRPELTISDADVETQIERQCKIRGKYSPTEQGAGEKDDVITADVRLLVDGAQIKQESNLQLGVRPSRLDGIPLPELDKTLQGVKAGEQRQAHCTITEDYERSDLRGKPAVFEFHVLEVRRLDPLSRAALAEQMGCDDESQLAQFVRSDLEAELGRLIETAQKEQILKYLLESTNIGLPEKLSARMTDRAVMRRVVDEHQRGVPPSEIEARIDELRVSASEEVGRDLRIEFIMEKLAAALRVGVTEEEINSEIARIAGHYNQRFDRVRDDLQRRGLLPQLAEQIRHEKCLTALLRQAKIVAVTPDKPGGESAEEK